MAILDAPTTPELPVREAPTTRRGRRVVPVLVALLAVVVGAELGVRAIADRLGPPSVDQFDVFLEQSLEDVDRLQRAGGADVVVLGSSVAGYAIDPARLAERSRVVGSAYNAWLPGAGVRVLRGYAEEILLDRLEPRAVVIGVTARELNDKGATSADLPTDSQYAQSTVRRGAITDGRLLDRIDRWASDRSYLLRYRRRLREPAQVLRHALGARAAEPADLRTPLGDATQHARTLAEANGRYRALEREALAAFSVRGAELAALELLIGELRARGIVTVLLDLPVAAPYVDLLPGGAADLARFEQALDALAARQGVPLVRVPHGPFEGSFADWSHLDATGAARLTDELARELDVVLGDGRPAGRRPS